MSDAAQREEMDGGLETRRRNSASRARGPVKGTSEEVTRSGKTYRGNEHAGEVLTRD